LLQELYLLQLELLEPNQLENVLPQRVEHVVYVVRDALALVRVLQQVPFQHALHVIQ
jgi:hypothetical protein